MQKGQNENIIQSNFSHYNTLSNEFQISQVIARQNLSLGQKDFGSKIINQIKNNGNSSLSKINQNPKQIQNNQQKVKVYKNSDPEICLQQTLNNLSKQHSCLTGPTLESKTSHSNTEFLQDDLDEEDSNGFLNSMISQYPQSSSINFLSDQNSSFELKNYENFAYHENIISLQVQQQNLQDIKNIQQEQDQQDDQLVQSSIYKQSQHHINQKNQQIDQIVIDNNFNLQNNENFQDNQNGKIPKHYQNINNQNSNLLNNCNYDEMSGEDIFTQYNNNIYNTNNFQPKIQQSVYENEILQQTKHTNFQQVDIPQNNYEIIQIKQQLGQSGASQLLTHNQVKQSSSQQLYTYYQFQNQFNQNDTFYKINHQKNSNFYSDTNQNLSNSLILKTYENINQKQKQEEIQIQQVINIQNHGLLQQQQQIQENPQQNVTPPNKIYQKEEYLEPSRNLGFSNEQFSNSNSQTNITEQKPAVSNDKIEISKLSSQQYQQKQQQTLSQQKINSQTETKNLVKNIAAIDPQNFKTFKPVYA
ncbi:hypothetical protein PPERSA_02803 [Pseudocohnilembus persalinus]|uniref:Uncharacterized protein n=1 Tax=Pseudocohnilembus persalinus TaxID=266149 RepID=A0A0V0QN83_PSEPJ|nr:hypothetical protein PPERSA_02803 [Pseudocohnilembus persalinus]|eukprot:KRX03424.1 hypothetical protein PPERSA_02803 [Pseudocohnilembus persalinus]